MSEYVIDCDYDVDEGLLPGEVREEIVRCRDCKFYDGDNGYGNYGCTLLDFGTKNIDDGFCAWGERRETYGD